MEMQNMRFEHPMPEADTRRAAKIVLGAVLLCIALLFVLGRGVADAEHNAERTDANVDIERILSPVEIDSYLLQTGMPPEHLDRLDYTSCEFIVRHMPEHGFNPAEAVFIETAPQPPAPTIRTRTPIGSLSPSDIDAYLLQTGMTAAHVAALDAITREFIVRHMLEYGFSPSDAEFLESYFWPEFHNANVLTRGSLLPLDGVSQHVLTFREDSTVLVFASYELTAPGRIRGRDSFRVIFGDALMSYQSGGQVWFRNPHIPQVADRTAVGLLAENTAMLAGTAFSGQQLGVHSRASYHRGIAFVHAVERSYGQDRSIFVTYTHSPDRVTIYLYGIRGLAVLAGIGFAGFWVIRYAISALRKHLREGL